MNKKKEKITKGYKAFNADWTCNDFKYEVGKTYEIEEMEMCRKGFHFCEEGVNVLNYYPDFLNQKYAEIEAHGQVITEKSKSVCKKITIKREVTKGEIIRSFKTKKKVNTVGFKAHASTSGDGAHSSTTGNKANSSTTGNRAHSGTTGFGAHSSTSGDGAHSSTTGNFANSSTSGYGAHSSTAGYGAHSSTTGYGAHSSTTGNFANSSTSGDGAHSSTTGNFANSSTSGDGAHSSTEGNNAISFSCGLNSRSKTTAGWIVIVERTRTGDIKKIHSGKIGNKIKNKIIKPNTWYWFDEEQRLKEEEAK